MNKKLIISLAIFVLVIILFSIFCYVVSETYWTKLSECEVLLDRTKEAEAYGVYSVAIEKGAEFNKCYEEHLGSFSYKTVMMFRGYFNEENNKTEA